MDELKKICLGCKYASFVDGKTIQCEKPNNPPEAILAMVVDVFFGDKPSCHEDQPTKTKQQ